MLFYFRSHLRIRFNIRQGLIDPEKYDDKLTPYPPADISNQQKDQPGNKAAAAQKTERATATKAPAISATIFRMTAPAEHHRKAPQRDANGSYNIQNLNNL